MNSAMLKGCAAELLEISKEGGVISNAAKSLGVKGKLLSHLDRHAHAYDLAGLGVLAVPSALGVAKNIQQARSGKKVEGLGHNLAELGGLGLLAAPVAAQMALKRH